MEDVVVGESRGIRKERTRRAILDAALRLSARGGLGAVSLRQVAKEVGMVPTAFYRHFDSLDQLGLELVDESFVSLRSMVRAVRTGNLQLEKIADRSVRVLVDHVHGHRAHFGFIARERTGGSEPVRAEVRRQLELFERELATDIARLPANDWSSADLRVLSNLIVTSMVATTERIIDSDGRPATEKEIVATAATQLRMLIFGALNWRSRPEEDLSG